MTLEQIQALINDALPEGSYVLRIWHSMATPSGNVYSVQIFDVPSTWPRPEVIVSTDRFYRCVACGGATVVSAGQRAVKCPDCGGGDLMPGRGA